MVAVSNIGIVSAPGHAIAFFTACVDVVGRHIKEANIIIRKVWRESANFNGHGNALPSYGKWL